MHCVRKTADELNIDNCFSKSGLQPRKYPIHIPYSIYSIVVVVSFYVQIKFFALHF